ncbi:hypothetical protein KKC62_00520 [Patescibacteria group bacterium]|nr:hypothetical protein [Patescibacteria group bacterium]MBU1952691.1 hypothetical protein [Patescibacteria group bacterium]
MSNTPKNFSKVIKKLADIFGEYQYAFRGTSSLVMQDLDMNVDDIDILCDEKTALAANKLLKDFLVEEVKYSESPKFKSFLGNFNVDGVKVEIMGNWQILDSKEVWSRVYDASDRVEVEYDNEKVFVTSVNLELEMFAKMGRWTAFQKIKKQIKPMKKMLIIDTYNFLHRAYHAIPSTFKGPDGQPTNAIYGFTSMIINVLDQVRPDYMVAALDGREPTFRVADFTAYKAHRKPMEEELEVQIPKVFEILDAFGIKKILVEGYEADDVIGTVAKKFSNEVEVVIISNDKDLWQLAGDHITIMVPGQKGLFEFMGDKEVDVRLGFEAEKIADYKGLRGDPSDNIPGVYGVGEVTATSLLKQFGSIEEIYKNIEKVKPDKLKEKLLNSYEQALMSKKLAQIVLDVPYKLDLDECKYSTFNIGRVKEELQKYNFKSLIRRLGLEPDEGKKKEKEVPDSQLSLL